MKTAIAIYFMLASALPGVSPAVAQYRSSPPRTALADAKKAETREGDTREAQVPMVPACPAMFSPAGLCFDTKTGDIVLAEAPANTVVFTNANCWTGYTLITDTFCFRQDTGDAKPLGIKSTVPTSGARK